MGGSSRIDLVRTRWFRRCWTLVVCALLTGSPAFARRLHVRTFTPDDGLAGSQTWVVYQDRAGYLWFGTASGLSRYDGTAFSSITVADGLPDPLVRTIVQSRDGHLWFGTNAGVAEYDGRTIRLRDDPDGPRRRAVWASAIDARGRLWFGTQDGGLIAYDGHAFRTYTDRDGLPGDYIYAIHCARDGAIWIGTRSRGIARFVPGPDGAPASIRIYTKADGLPADAVHAIAEDERGTIYAGTRGGGVCRYDGTRFTSIRPRSGLDVYALLVNRRGELVIGTVDAGVSICALPAVQDCRRISRGEGLRVDNVYALHEDREESLWVGLNNGVTQLVSEAFESYTQGDGLPDNTVQSVFADRNGEIWLGTYAGLVRGRVEAGGEVRFDTFTMRDGLPADAVWDALRDRAGNLWVATRSGLARLGANGRLERFSRTDGLASDYVYDLFEDHQGRLWLATLEGVSRSNVAAATARPSFTSYTVRDGLPGSQIYTIAEDQQGKIWIGTAGQGIAVFDGSRFARFTTRDGLGSDSINVITVAKDGTLWIGTGGGGLARFEHGRFSRYGAGAGISSDTVSAIVEGEGGRLWLGTNHGIDLFDERSGRVVRHFDSRSGMSSDEVLTGNAIARASDDSLWFAFSGGLTHYRPAIDRSGDAVPVVMLKRVRIGNGRQYDSPFSTVAARPNAGDWLTSDTLQVGPDAQSVRFDFRALWFRSPSSIRYQVQLVGFDPRWLEETSVPFKEYTNLPPGDYTFRVRARAEGNRWSGETASVRLTVQPPVWKTWWARSGFVLLLMFAALAMHKLRTSRIRRRNLELEAIITERTSELAEHARELEIANQRIQDADRTKNRFLATVSHELRTPLNAIIGFSEVLQQRLAGRTGVRELTFLHNISESGHHLLNLINNLLDLSKIEAGKMEVVVEDVNVPLLLEGVRGVADGMASQRGIDIVTRCDNVLPAIRADEQKLRQILLNLLSNAIKFSPEKQRVEVVARFHAAGMSPLTGEAVEIAVADHGIGMKPEEQHVVFDEFRQAEGGRTRGGTGLGLAITRKLTELQGGVVTLDSAVGRGSTFRIFLPAAPAS